jgi:hypothetical protein
VSAVSDPLQKLPPLSPEQLEIREVTRQQCFYVLRGVYGESFDPKRGEVAAKAAAADVLQLGQLTEAYFGRPDAVLVIELIKMPVLAGQERQALGAIKVRSFSALHETPDPARKMDTLLVLGILTSPIARALVYYEGHAFGFKMGFVQDETKH